MLENFENEAQEVIVAAESISFSLGHSHVGSEHLLLSLLKMKNLDFTKILESYDITEEDVYKDIVRLFGKKDVQPFYIEHSDTFKKILEDALKRVENEKATTNDLVYVLLNTKDIIAIKFLKKQFRNKSLDYETFVKEIKKEQRPREIDETILQMKRKMKSLNISYAYILDCNEEKIILKRDNEIQKILVGLCCQEKPNVALTGPAGVGKSAIVEELSRYLQYENTVERLKKYIVIRLDLTASIAGTRYRGEFEEKIQKYLDFIKDKKVITFVDEGHQLMHTGASEGAISISEILKPYLSRGEYKFIIATTEDEYKQITSDAAMSRRFRHIQIDEPLPKDVYDMIYKKVENLSKYHQTQISENMVRNIIDVCQSIPKRYFPDKAIDVIDYSMSYAEIFNNGVIKMEDIYEYIKQLGGTNESVKSEINTYC